MSYAGVNVSSIELRLRPGEILLIIQSVCIGIKLTYMELRGATARFF